MIDTTLGTQNVPRERVRRILVVDDNAAIHETFRKILCPQRPNQSRLQELEASLFGTSDRTSSPSASFVVDAVSQGRDGYEAVRRMRRAGTPYSLAFVDMRMPPGWDGVETASQMWAVDPAIQIVICSAYSDYSWNDVIKRLNRPDLRLLRKPFETKDVLEFAYSLTSKYLLKHGKGLDSP
jgi:CheY-like chemotaxis protein